MVVVGGGGEAGLDYVDAELGELPGYWGCNWGGDGGKVWVWEWSLMGRNREWEMERQSGSEGERTEMRDRGERSEIIFSFFRILLQYNSNFGIVL